MKPLVSLYSGLGFRFMSGLWSTIGPEISVMGMNRNARVKRRLLV